MKNPLLDDVQQASSSSEDTTVRGMSETNSEIQRGEAIDGKERVKRVRPERPIEALPQNQFSFERECCFRIESTSGIPTSDPRFTKMSRVICLWRLHRSFVY